MTLNRQRQTTPPPAKSGDAHKQWDPRCENMVMLGGMTMLLFGAPEPGGIPGVLGVPASVTFPAAMAGGAVAVAGCVGQWLVDRAAAADTRS